jgi:hypothetical protein
LIKKLLEQISDFLNTFDCFFTSIETTYRAPASYGDASDLIAYLNLAIGTENKTNFKSCRQGAGSIATSPEIDEAKFND